MDLTKQERRARRRFGVIPKWFELLCICAATIAAGFFGGRQTVVQADSPKPEVTVTATATVTAAPTTDPTGEATPTPDDTAQVSSDGEAPAPGSSVYLAERDVIDGDGDTAVEPVTMGGTHYAKSVRLSCTSAGGSAVYSTSGYERLTAKVGILADSPNAIGSVGSVQVSNAAGNPIGKPLSIRSSDVKDLSVDISGQDQIRLTCVMTKPGEETATYFYGGLGDATLS
ncbi:NPCBM/NEW2 domain-containing protein [Streptomyces sp. NPDC002580]|uniref:NPCBM/NEW2 domain-containing protein n=1 Tax=Streptomyces sp. NPDC002580 TaxID=3364653 RepID=UPI0036A8BAF2